MVTETRTRAREVATAFANKIGAMPVQRLSVMEDRDRIHMWLLTDEIDAERESQFYDVVASLCDEFPDDYIRLHIINPRTFPDERYRLSSVPQDAVNITIPQR